MINSLNELKFSEEIVILEDFNKNYELLTNDFFDINELTLFNEEGFLPIRNIKNNLITITTSDENLLKRLKKEDLKYFFKYYNSELGIVYVSEEILFNLMDNYDNKNTEYSDEEALDFFNDIMQEANRKAATDIHVSWENESVSVKYRIDGEIVPQPHRIIPKSLGESFKNICVNKTGEDEYEKNEISGKFDMIIDQKERGYRVAIGPTVKGYSIVIRSESLINKNTRVKDWGYSPKAIELINKMKDLPYGICLVTGPTGSGKSTLLYTIINEVLLDSDKIIKTIEDPVEIDIDGIDQFQVNLKGEKSSQFTFAKAVKLFLRQDPDFILVGEVRDNEVADVTIQAAKTGHLTWSTLHTNSVESTFTRLLDMDMEIADLEDTVRGIVAQRLIPTLCEKCKIQKKDKYSDTVYYERNEKGCSFCHSSKIPGYKGRAPITEIAILEVGEENYKKENFIEYYSYYDNLMYLFQQGKVDKTEIKRHVRLNDDVDIKKQIELNDLWAIATKEGIESKDIFPYYQIIIDTKSNKIIGYQSLMRMKKNDGDILSPIDFMNIAKESSFFFQITNLLLNKIIKDYNEFNHKHDLKIQPKIYFPIDEFELKNEDFIVNLFKLIEENNLKDIFVFDINYVNNKFINDFILKLKNERKYFVSINNFGDNLKDFEKIKNLNIDYLKIKNSYIQNIDENKSDQLIVKTIKELCNEYNIECIASFVRSKEISSTLNEIGINNQMGFYINKPKDKLIVEN